MEEAPGELVAISEYGLHQGELVALSMAAVMDKVGSKGGSASRRCVCAARGGGGGVGVVLLLSLLLLLLLSMLVQLYRDDVQPDRFRMGVGDAGHRGTTLSTFTTGRDGCVGTR